jgi:class 3 adenylate cyclase/tetratricopeptide (TPR) repeat protein
MAFIPSAVPRERKLLTLLFADLTGYTALAGTLDPEEVYGFIGPAMNDLIRLVASYGGTVAHVMGDGFMAVFGVPAVHEDDAERAVRAGLATVEHIRQLNRGRQGVKLPEVHAGVNTGEVMVAAAAEEPSGFAVVGDTVNVASRIAGLAGGGQVFVSERTKRLTEHALRYGPVRRLRAKGKPKPLAVYEVLGAITEAPAGHVSSARSTAFVGRTEALHTLSEEWAEVKRSGRARVLVVSGDAGIGKSRLAAEFGHRLDGATVVAGRSPAYGRWLPQAALSDGIRELAGIGAESAAEDALAAIDRLAGHLSGRGSDPGAKSGLPARALARQIRILLGMQEDAPRTATEPWLTGPDVRQAARTVVEAIAARGPVLVVLDDLHWADPALVQILTDAARAPWIGPIFVLGLARPELASELPRLELGGLSRDEMLAVLNTLLGEGIPQEVTERLCARAGGNPLFLEESVHMLVETAALVRDGQWRVADWARVDSVPPTLRLLTAARIDALAAAEKRVLQVAAVSGESTWDRLMTEVDGGSEGADVLGLLEARDLVHRLERSRVPDAVEYEFKHVLVRDVAYESLPRSDRARLHESIGDWLGRQLGDDPGEEVASLAHHYEQAWRLRSTQTGGGPSPDTTRRAASYLERWGHRVFSYQPRLAESVYARGLEVAQTDQAAVGSPLWAALLIGRAECLIELARAEEGARLAAEASVLAAAERGLRARALLAMGRAESDQGNVVTARRKLEEALALLRQEGDVPSQAIALQRLSETWRFDDFERELGFLVEAHRLLASHGDRRGAGMLAQELAYRLSTEGGREFLNRYEDAHRLAEEEGDIRSRAALLRTWAYYNFYCGWSSEAVRAAREAAPLARRLGDTWVEVDTLVIEALVAGAVAPPDEAEAAADRLLWAARAARGPRITALARLAGVRPALRQGRVEVARKRLGSGKRALVALRAQADMIDVWVTEAQFLLDRGVWNRVEAAATSIEARGREPGWRLFLPQGIILLGRARLGAGRLEEACASFDRAVEEARTANAGGHLEFAAALRDQASILLEQPRSESTVATQDTPEVEATVLENEGLRARAEGRLEPACRALDRSILCWEHLGSTVWLARALHLLATTKEGAGDAEAALAARARRDDVLAAIAAPPSALAEPR